MTSLGSKIDTHDASIKSTITTSQNTITNAINGVKNDITEQGTTLKNVINTKGCVKSVQRNYIILTARAFNDGYRIRINAVNPKKCVFNLISYSWSSFPLTIDIQENYFILKPAPNYNYDYNEDPFFTWQLIEFY